MKTSAGKTIAILLVAMTTAIQAYAAPKVGDRCYLKEESVVCIEGDCYEIKQGVKDLEKEGVSKEEAIETVNKLGNPKLALVPFDGQQYQILSTKYMNSSVRRVKVRGAGRTFYVEPEALECDE